MKNIFYLLILLLNTGLWSCYDDKSSYDTKQLPDVKFGLTDDDNMIRTAVYLDEFKLDIPVTKDGDANSPDLGYEWRIQTGSSSLNYEQKVISNERILDVTVDFPINAGGYKLLLTVTDSTTSLSYFALFNLVVTSEFGEGLLVAHSMDGKSSDFSLVMDKNLTKDFAGEKKVVSNIYATKGEVFPDKIKNVLYSIYGSSKNLLWVTGEKAVYRVDIEDYSYVDTKGVVPMEDVASFVGNAFYSSSQVTLMIGNHQVYQNSYGNQNIFIKPEKVANSNGVTSNYVDNDIIAAATQSNGNRANAVWYDSKMECFARYNYFFAAPKFNLFSASENDPSFPFDPSNVPGKEAIAGDVISNTNLAMVLKDKSTNEYDIYVFDLRNSVDTLVAPTPSALYHVPADLKTIIDASVSICFSMVDPIMYVATENEVYAVRMALGKLTYSKQYTASAGEKISIVKFYTQGRYKVNPEDFSDDKSPLLPLNNKAVLVAVQAGEYTGKVYFVPQKDAGTGNLDQTKQVMYDGFGNISDITIQGK